MTPTSMPKSRTWVNSHILMRESMAQQPPFHPNTLLLVQSLTHASKHMRTLAHTGAHAHTHAHTLCQQCIVRWDLESCPPSIAAPYSCLCSRMVWLSIVCNFTESLRVELRCRKEEEELSNFDIEKANHKAMAKMVNAVREGC